MSVSRKIDKLLQEGAIDYIRNNKGKIAGGLGALGAAGAGAYMLQQGHEVQGEVHGPNSSEYHKLDGQATNINERYENDANDFNKKLSKISTKYGENLYNFEHPKHKPSLDSLVKQYADIKEPYQTMEDTIDERDAYDDSLEKLYTYKMGQTQETQSRLSDEYASIKDSDKPADLIRKREIAEKLTNLKVKLPSEYGQSGYSESLTKRILNWDGPEHREEVEKQLEKQQKIQNQIDKQFGGRKADEFIQNNNSIDDNRESIIKNYGEKLRLNNLKTLGDYRNAK